MAITAFRCRALGGALVAAALAAAALSALAAAPAEASTADRVVRVARSEAARGVHEMPNGSNESPRIARYRSAIRWASGPAAWCGYFASWVAREAGAPIGEGGYGIGLVSEIRGWGKRTGRWTTRPVRGSIVVFRHAHVGIVERVTSSSVVTIEGNHDNRVARVWRGRGEIRGYVRLIPSRSDEREDEREDEPWEPEPFRWSARG
jgi:CHAP domain-containing protein